MNNGDKYTVTDSARAAYADGRRAGLAVAALAVGAVAFISLLGVEKAILAFVLAGLSLAGAMPGSQARRISFVAMLIAGLYMLTYVTVLVMYHDKLAELISMLQKLG